MNYISLFIKTPAETELDLSQEMDIALQYSIADIKDITKRNSAYSKTIILPGTKNNNFWFGNLFDINSDFTMFNPNKKVDARILVNTETVIDGFLQLKKIKKLVNTDAQGNLIQYEVVVFNNAVDLMTELGEKTLNQLDLSKYNHTYTNINVKNSWTNTYKQGYVYPMYGTEGKDSNYKVTWFYPATYYRTILDRILYEAGFGWTGSLKTNNQFNKEIIPYVSDGLPKLTQDDIDSRLFYVGVTNSTASTSLGNFPNTFTPGGIVLQDTTYPFTNESTPYFDPNNQWNSTTYEWNVTNNGQYSVSFNNSFQLILKNTSASTTMQVVDVNEYPNVTANFYLQYSNNGGITWTTWDTASVTKTYNNYQIAPLGTATQSFNVNKNSSTIPLNFGSKVRLRINMKKSNSGWWSGTGGAATPNMTSTLQLSPSNGGNWLRNKSYITDISEGDTVKLNQFLSEKIKQKDLITDLIKRYNLYIQTDPNNPRRLIFDTRPDFYSTGTILDWTNKKDYSQEDGIELLSELQFKQMIFTYKNDSDEYNKGYTEFTGDTYGQYKYTFDNDFVKGEERTESPFSPTPIVKTAFGAYVPAINPEKPKVNPRVLYYGGLKDYGSNWSWIYQDSITGATNSTESFTTYPYAGHFDDPITPTLDINFGTCKYYWYNDISSVTPNNMYNEYWSNYTNQIEDGRMLTAKFYLDETDIRFIKDNFNTKIFILDSYYYVNKITDYKPLNNSTTTVELLKINEGVKWQPKQSKVIGLKPNIYDNFVSGINIGFNNGEVIGGVVVGSGNVLGGTTEVNDTTKLKSQLILGDNNEVMGDNSIVSGSNNKVENDKSFVIAGDENQVKSGFVIDGDNNTLTGANSFVIGGFNNILTGDNAMAINASGLSSSESNTVFLGPSFSVSTIDGTMKVNGLTFSGVGGSGTTDYVTKFTSPTTVGTSSIIDNGTQVILTNDGSSSFPTVGFNSANDTGFFFAYQHPFNNRFAICANGATAAIFTSAATIISSLATIPGSDKRNVTVDGVGNLSATASVGVQDGTATVPSIYFNGDTDTGLFRSGTNRISTSSGGATTSISKPTGGVEFPLGIQLRSPDGTLWQISINNAGVITTAALG